MAGTDGYMKVWTGAAFELKPMKYWTGSAWTVKPVKRWTGSVWETIHLGATFLSDPDIVSINTDGWTVQDANSTAVGWGTSQANNYDPFSAPRTIFVERPSYTTSATSTSIVDELTIMSRVRQPYPSQASWEAVANSEVRSSISHYVFSGDTVYDSAGASGNNITNNSTKTYPAPICQFDTHDKFIVTDQTITIGLYVSHWFARNKQAVAAVKFIFTDSANNTVEEIVGSTTLKNYTGSGLYAPIFEANNVSIANLNSGVCTVDYIIYPWAGTAWQASVDGNPDNEFTNCRFTFQNDVSNSYGQSHAAVSANGTATGTAGVFATEAAMDTAIGPVGAITDYTKVYATIGAALTACSSYNNTNYSRADCGGSTIHLEEDTYIKNTSDVWGNAVTSQAFPTTVKGRTGTVKANVIIAMPSTATDDASCPKKLVLRDLSLTKTVATNGLCFDSASTLATKANDYIIALVDCDAIASAYSYAAVIYRWHRRWAINCGCDDSAYQINWMYAWSTVAAGAGVVGCNNWWSQGVLGGFANKQSASTNNTWMEGNKSAENDWTVGCHLLAHSFLYKTVYADIFAFTGPVTVGAHIVGSVFERFAEGGSDCVSLHDFINENETINMFFKSNTVAGHVFRFQSNASGNNNVIRDAVCEDNYIHSWAQFTDLYNAVPEGPQGARQGNWPMQHGCGMGGLIWHKGDYYGANTFSTTTQQLPDTRPLRSASGNNTVRIIGDFEHDASSSGDGTSNGDYRPNANGVTSFTQIPAGFAPFSHDFMGKALVDDGTDYIGALQPV